MADTLDTDRISNGCDVVDVVQTVQSPKWAKNQKKAIFYLFQFIARFIFSECIYYLRPKKFRDSMNARILLSTETIAVLSVSHAHKRFSVHVDRHMSAHVLWSFVNICYCVPVP